MLEGRRARAQPCRAVWCVGRGNLSCQSHTVWRTTPIILLSPVSQDDLVEFRMDLVPGNLDAMNTTTSLPHGVNFQDAIFPDTVWKPPYVLQPVPVLQMVSTLTTSPALLPRGDPQEDSRLLCSSVQGALFEEEEKSRKQQERLGQLERRNRQLKERVRKVKRSLRNARKSQRRAEQERQGLEERLRSAERRAGHHLNSITQEATPNRYQEAVLHRTPHTPL
nr:coiled-coil domain-containing protein 3-like [Salvelinus alpinus]